MSKGETHIALEAEIKVLKHIVNMYAQQDIYKNPSVFSQLSFLNSSKQI